MANTNQLSPVSLVIPNYNGSKLLRENLPFVISALESYGGGGEIIVVDDGSKDGSLDVLKKEFPTVVCIVHQINKGFSAAVLTGVKAAKNECLIVLNSDVQPDFAFIEPLIKVLTEEDVFAVQPLIKDDDGAVNPFSIFRFKYRWGRLNRIPTENIAGAERLYCVYVSGGSMAVERTKFLALGGFHPIFKPFYWEDFDLCVRAWRLGWESIVVPTSVIVHQDHGSIKDNFKRRKIRNALNRNKLLVEWVHLSTPALFLTAIPRLIGRLLARLVVGDIFYVGAIFEAFKRGPQAVRLRNELKKTSALSLQDVVLLVEEKNKKIGVN